jgi:hypothetical protein
LFSETIRSANWRIQENNLFSGSYPAIPFELWEHQAEAYVVVAVAGVVIIAIGIHAEK